MKKKILATLLAVAVLVSSLVLTVSAARYESLAEELNSLGLFRGTEAGFDLDRAPNRGEALVMLLRLLGDEEAALDGDYEHPFNDVPDWLSPYVAFAYNNGLTTGVAADRFGSTSTATAQQFVTFVLRALGYDDSAGGDFTWDGAIAFGTSVGVFDPILDTGEFLRDHMVAISYLALAAAPASGCCDNLLSRLVRDGAVTASAAEPVFAKFALYEEYMAVEAQMAEMTEFEMTGTMAVDMGEHGTMNTEINLTLSGTELQMSSIGTVTDGDATIELSQWVVDGYEYTRMAIGENVTQHRTPFEFDMAEIQQMTQGLNIDELSFAQLLLMTDIGRGAGGQLVITYRAFALQHMVNQVLQQIPIGELGMDDSVDFSFGDTVMYLYTDAEGNASRTRMIMNLTISLEAGGIAVTIPINMNMDMQIVEDLEIEFPDDLDDATAWPMLAVTLPAEVNATNGTADADSVPACCR